LKIKLGTKNNPQTIQVNARLAQENMNLLKELLMEYKDVFSWTYKDLKGIPPKLAQDCIEMDTSIPLAH
jgi:hypothetical protein